MCPYLFSFFSILGPSCVHIFFDSTCLSCNNIWRDRSTHIMEHLFYGMVWWYNADFSQKHSKVYMVCTWILIMNAWQKFLSRVTTIWQSSMQRQAAYVYRVFMIYHHMAFVGFWHIKQELCKGFSKFLNKFPMHLNSKSEDHIIKPYNKHQQLRWAYFPKYFCSQASRR